jgi:Sugar (and other) transporter
VALTISMVRELRLPVAEFQDSRGAGRDRRSHNQEAGRPDADPAKGNDQCKAWRSQQMTATLLASTIAASTIGTIVEWYDFLLYATAAALIFNKLFFPQFDPVAGTIASFAAYAVGFLVRPIGGIVFGWLGDRIGRKPVLLATLT